jgi:hypothetical protein
MTFFKNLVLFIILYCFIPHPCSASSFFKVIWKNGKAWFQSPDGSKFLSLGVNAIGDQSYRAPNDDYYNPVKNQYHGNTQAWIENVLKRLKIWNFNTIGAWSDNAFLDKKFPYTYMTYIARGSDWDRVLDNVFSSEFESLVQENAKGLSRFKNDPFLIGYFLDNELPWWGQYGWPADGQKTLFEQYAGIAVDNDSKEAFVNFLKDRYANDIESFDQVWGTSFKSFEELEDPPLPLIVKTRKQKNDANLWSGVVAERYFLVTSQAVRSVDPNHLILGVRFAGETPWAVVEACGKYCDVVSVNQYQKSGNIDKKLLDNFYFKSQKPILISEYSFSASENQSNDPNTYGADVTVTTQKERSKYLDRFVRQLLSLSYVVGSHWFEWSDESPKGRFDGEDQNYGLVDLQDKPYTLITREQAKLNQLAPDLHENSIPSLPDHFVATDEPDYRRATDRKVIPENRLFLKMDSSAMIHPWSDTATEGQMTPLIVSNALELNFQSGSGWGCGVSCPSNVEPLVASDVVDLTGYDLFQFQAFAPEGLNFILYISESGNGDPSLTTFAGLNGADGESYSFPSFEGSGQWQTYQVDLGDLKRRTNWGNQHGNNILDLQSISDVDFYIPGGQGNGKLIVRDLQFRTK